MRLFRRKRKTRNEHTIRLYPRGNVSQINDSIVDMAALKWECMSVRDAVDAYIAEFWREVEA